MMKLNFFGLLMKKSPMQRLLEHYEIVRRSINVIKGALECYTEKRQLSEFRDLQCSMDKMESQADNIIRSIRNNLPRSILMPVNKTQLLNYTTAQDNILDSAQESLNWLSMRAGGIPREFQADITDIVNQASELIIMLGPALKGTVSLIHLESLDRDSLRDQYLEIRENKNAVSKSRHRLVGMVYQSDMEFKDIYLIVHYVQNIYSMCHSTGKCAEILRSMITR